MNHTQHNAIISFIWSIADDVLRDVFVRGKYRDVILPMTVLRRLDVLLEPTKDRVLETVRFLEEQGIDDLSSLCSPDFGSGLPFWNTSPYTLKRLLDSPSQLEHNFRAYLDGYSPNVRDIIEKFRLRDQIKTLVEADALFLLVSRFVDTTRINLSPHPIVNAHGFELLPGLDNRGMGYVFEELLRRFSEENNEEAGEHFTPRDIVELMTHLVFEPVADRLVHQGSYYIYDDACGSGGMLTLSREFLERRGDETGKKFNISLFGQEVNPETYAICQADMLISGQNPDGIKYGSTLSRDGHPGLHADFMLANPPYGKSWAKDLETILDKKTKSVHDARFLAHSPQTGEPLRLTPASSDGQLLFTVNMLGKMVNTDLGSRIAVVHNGSALFTGDAGSGESNIRRWMLENDWLEAIIALPLRMFYNTGIATYIWLFSNRKSDARRNRVQLIDGTKQFHKLRKNLGQKGHFFDPSDIQTLVETLMRNENAGISKTFPTSEFLYRKVCVERPLRLRVELDRSGDDLKTNALIAGLEQLLGSGPHFDYNLVRARARFNPASEKRFRATCCFVDERAQAVRVAAPTLTLPREREREPGTARTETWRRVRGNEAAQGLVPSPAHAGSLEPEAVPFLPHGGRLEPEAVPSPACGGGLGWGPPHAQPAPGEYEPDPQLRDWESVPFAETVEEYFAREVAPHVPDAWMDLTQTRIGAEISFTKYFYEPARLRPLSEITREILDLETQTEGVLHRLAGELSA